MIHLAPPHPIALNHADAAAPATWAIALNMTEGEQAPEWVEVLPLGPIKGIDGRDWVNDRPQEVIQATQALGHDLPIDWNHATDLQAPKGGSSPAAAWIDAKTLEVSGNMIRGKVAWNAAGAASVANREYRYLSPAFHFDPGTKRVRRLLAASLVNRPNLHLPALNQQENPTMDERLLAALALPKDATVEQCLTALNAMRTKLTETETQLQTALNSQNTPDATKFVPMVQYNTAVARATQAETALNTQREAEQVAAINTAVDAAIEAGKIAPATKAFYIASCQQEGGLERFNTFIETAPKVISDDSSLEGKETPNTATHSTLTAEEKAICQTQGIDEEAYLKTKQELDVVSGVGEALALN